MKWIMEEAARRYWGVVAMNRSTMPPDAGKQHVPHAAGIDTTVAVGAVGQVWTAERPLPGWVANSGLIGLVLVVAAGMFVQVGRGVLFTPQDAVLDFFGSLEAHSVDAAPQGSTRTDLVQSPSYTPPSGAVVEGVRRLGADQAVVTVSFELASTRWRTDLTAVQARFWGPWTVGASGSLVDVTWPHGVKGVTATVAGSALRSGDHLLPGVYTVEATGSDVFETAGPVSLLVSGTDPEVTVAPAVRPRADLVPRLSALVASFLDACVDAAPDDSVVVPGCPLVVSDLILPWPKHVSWHIDSYPQVSLQVGDIAALEVDTTTPGAATVSYQQGDVVKQRTIPVKATGWVELVAGRMIWHRNNLEYVSE